MLRNHHPGRHYPSRSFGRAGDEPWALSAPPRGLTNTPALARAEVPDALQKLPGLGCREVKWRGETLTLVCFAAQGEVVHLFGVPKAALPDVPFTSTPAFARVQGWSTTS